ncbi:glycoside hydrolase family 13 protein [Georgenia subflava]|uniref:Alpha,alpha-phosphotrehalase n=1 Tax=Georgenia subflava TaxID=1622177 RepID=A0A6N7EIQ8_9MICO|nr:alpha-glucosidase [Georgenia subflava]MPV36485.1 alpha,alpha-phosphotrehalase [Georgenia subflava]
MTSSSASSAPVPTAGELPGRTGRTRRGEHTPAREWWRTAVVYQVYPRSFADSDGDGVGDLRGVLGKLDYLERLGVDVVWLSPIYVSPQDDNGYDIADYQAIDPTFGTMADLDELIAGLHARGMRLVMDLVVNHTSDEHAWFAESRTGKDSPKRDWYWWRPPRPGRTGGEPGAEPTNWHSFFSGSTWEWDAASGEYYLHLFSRKQPDLNWENPEVREAVYKMMRWWVARGVDGFRMDVINLISKDVGEDGSLPDGAVDPGLPAGGSRFGDGAPYYANGPRLQEFLAEMNREVLAAGTPDGEVLITVGEMPGVTLELARDVTDPAHRQLDMVFTFEHMGLDHGAGGKWSLQPLHLPDLKANLAAWQEGLADAGWNSLYWNNHDQPRIVSRWGDDSAEHRVTSAKTLGTVLHMLRGTPYVYQGEEIGMTNVGWAEIEDYRDIETLNYYRESVSGGASDGEVMAGIGPVSRDNARTPMQWDNSANAGFTTGTPWLAVNPSYVTINTAAAVADPDSVFHHYRRLVELRHTHDIVVDGRFELLLPDHEQVFAYTRTTSTSDTRVARETEETGRAPAAAQTLLVVANFSSEPAEVALPGLADVLAGEVLLTTHDGAPVDGEQVRLAPWESRVYLA